MAEKVAKTSSTNPGQGQTLGDADAAAKASQAFQIGMLMLQTEMTKNQAINSFTAKKNQDDLAFAQLISR